MSEIWNQVSKLVAFFCISLSAAFLTSAPVLGSKHFKTRLCVFNIYISALWTGRGRLCFWKVEALAFSVLNSSSKCWINNYPSQARCYRQKPGLGCVLEAPSSFWHIKYSNTDGALDASLCGHCEREHCSRFYISMDIWSQRPHSLKSACKYLGAVKCSTHRTGDGK